MLCPYNLLAECDCSSSAAAHHITKHEYGIFLQLMAQLARCGVIWPQIAPGDKIFVTMFPSLGEGLDSTKQFLPLTNHATYLISSTRHIDTNQQHGSTLRMRNAPTHWRKGSEMSYICRDERLIYWHKAIMEPFSAALCNDWYHGVPRSARCPAVSVAICCRR